MKYLLSIFIIFSAFVAQVLAQDTILPKPVWGIQASVGVTTCTYDGATAQFLKNENGVDLRVTVNYKYFFVGATFRPVTTNLKNTLLIRTDTIGEKVNINVIKADLQAGVNLKITKFNEISVYAGYATSSFYALNLKDYENAVKFGKTRGITAGLTLNNYLKIAHNQYLNLYFNYNWNRSGYRTLHPSLGNEFRCISVGIAYKGWFSPTSTAEELE
jgi:hypothetical protein